MDNIQGEKDENQDALLVNVVPAQILRFDMVCRVCGNENEKNIQIFGQDGQNYELALKMNTYLPIKVVENDRLPAGCCWTCASAILSWHDLIVASIETDRKIRALQIVLAKPLTMDSERNEGECETVLNHRKETTSISSTSSTSELTDLNQVEDSTTSTQIEKSISNVSKDDQSASIDSNTQPSAKLPFHCVLCNSKYIRKFDLKRHMLRKHSINNTETFNPTMKTKRGDYAKFKVIINDKIFYKCDLCESHYKHGYNLTRHKLKHINGPNSYTCDVCGKTYSAKSALKRHNDEIHASKRHVCKICNKQFRAKVTLTQHMNIHTNSRPFICEICGKTFRQKSSLRVHKMYHSNNNFRFKCEVCGKQFRRNCELKVHITLHTGLKAYRCNLCGKRFRLMYTLKKHIKLHDPLDVCHCDVCGASFSHLRYLNNHKKTHENTSND